VATKCDRLSSNRLRQSLDDLKREHSEVPIVAFSAKTGMGKDELWRQIRQASERSAAV